MDNQRIALRVAGALSGCVYVTSLEESVGNLRIEIARLLDVDTSAAIKLIVGGRQLSDDAKTLREYRVSPTSRVLVTKGAADPGMSEADQRQRKLDKLKTVVGSMAARDGRGLTDDYEFALENQDGMKLHVDPGDRKAIVMGLALHAKGTSSMQKGKYEDALGELQCAEEAFSCCNADILQSVDNFALVLIDIVWCCFKLQDIQRLAICRNRLERAQKLLVHAHGPNAERLRAIHGNFFPELTTYLRLELLQGVVSYHMQEYDTATQQLQKALQRHQQLQVSDQDLALMQNMGYTMKEAQRALRFCNGDINQAVVTIAEERKKKEEQRDKKRRHSDWLNERVQYGKTSSGVYVDLDELDKLQNFGYDRSLAAEALRSHDNDGALALDELLNPEKRTALELAVLTRVTPQEELDAVDSSQVEQLVMMGYSDTHARLALSSTSGDANSACAILDAWGDAAKADDPTSSGATATDPTTGEPGSSREGPSRRSGHKRSGPDSDTQAAPVEQPDDDESRMLRKELRKDVKDDPMAAYDIDISEEGQVIQLYSNMLQSL